MKDNPDNNPNLGEPDFSNFMDDDTIEIDSHHVGGSSHESGAQNSSLPIGDTIAMVAGMAMSFVATRKGEHWRLNQDEAAELSTASQSVCDEYMPDFEMSPTWLLVGVVGAIAAPRLIIDAKINAKAQAQKEQAKEKEQSVNEPERTETPEYDTTE
jgi:hypothetical protein